MPLKKSNFVKTFRDLLGFGSKRLSAQQTTVVIDRGTNFSLSSSELFLPQVSRVALHDEREAKDKGEVPNNE